MKNYLDLLQDVLDNGVHKEIAPEPELSPFLADSCVMISTKGFRL